MSIELNCRNYLSVLRKCSESFHHISAPRTALTYELIHHTTEWDMQYPVLAVNLRKLNYAFMFAEAYWILSGSAILEEVKRYCSNISRFSDDGIILSGAYGPQFIQQYQYVVEALRKDIETRQAVMTFWRPTPRNSKDIPCTISVQFLIRNEEVHVSVYMRSSDVWLGLPYDVFCFSMVAEFIRLIVDPVELRLGKLRITAGSQHLYQSDRDKAMEVVEESLINGVYPAMSSHGFNHPVDLLKWLGTQRGTPTYVQS